ncbi:FecCD family ABC transporter permease [Sphingobium lignivorans]|uniref:Iron complex transport system permease protein n=1 Tax=Sphingobium lignivorans TaxID=2735886 RepID=A0ABR6NK72_9SPHN|nr:iron ABC transporter permease [Sphingobium lignivorans]MBB5987052.1 iron complex transport system permease protein [Sphingobium lignivorans]
MSRGGKLALLCAGVVLAFVLALLAGKVWVPIGGMASGDPRAIIMMDLRLPRALLAMTIGAGLGLSGAALQGYTRNPLADPAILGISALAALGAVTAIFLGLGASGEIVAAFAMAGAALAVLLLGLLAGRTASAVAFLLAGTVLSSLAGALTALLITLAPNPFATSEIINWLMGALTDRGWAELRIAAPLVLAGSLLVLAQGRALDALTLGEVVARSLGVDLARLQWMLAVALAFTVGGSVAVTGIVGFVGLMVPHMLRPFFGAEPSRLLLPSALGGALLVLVADSLVRLTPGAGELRLGVAMALIGAPFFFALLARYRRELV